MLRSVTQLLCLMLVVPSSTTGQTFAKALRSLEQDGVADFKVQLQQKLEGTRMRTKRQAGLLTSIPELGGFTADHLRVGGSAPGGLPYVSDYNLTTWTSIRHEGRDQVFVGTRRGDLVLLDVTERDETAQVIALSINERVGTKVKAFSFHDEQWFVVLQESSAVQMYQRVGRGLERRQLINLNGEADFDVINVGGINYLALATYRTISNAGYSYQGKVRLYRWVRTQFDEIANKNTYGAGSIACWEVFGVLYVSVAQEVDDGGNLYVGSPVFLFNAMDGASLVRMGDIRTKGPRKVANFFVSGGHYLVFIGQFDAEIYWWSNGQFLSWQVISGTSGASDVSVLHLYNGEVVLVIGLKEEIFFLTLDATGHYVVSFTMQFAGFDIEALQFMFDGRDFYALALFASSPRTLPDPIWKLTLDKYELPDLTAVDPLVQCLRNLKELTEERKNELDAVRVDMDRVWLTNRDQVVTTDVIVAGAARADGPSFIDDILITVEVAGPVSPTEVGLRTSDLLTAKELSGEKLGDIFFKSAKQEISGTTVFPGVITVPLLDLHNSDSGLTINGVEASRLSSYSLKKSGNQSFGGTVTVGHASANEVSTFLLNGVNSNDVALLTGTQKVTGHWQFSDVHAGDVATSFLNAVPFVDVVTTSAVQEVTALKNFMGLTANVVGVHERTNGMDLGEMSGMIVTIDTEQETNDRMEFSSTIFAENALIGGPVDEVDLVTLDTEAVKKDIAQELGGSFTFMSECSILNDLVVKGLVNDIDIDRQVTTLRTNQNLTGNFHFTDVVDFKRSVRTNELNYRDLKTDVVLRNRDVLVEGVKSFRKDLLVGSIDLDESVTIDGMDVSVESAVVVKQSEGTVTVPTAFPRVVVLGDLYVHDVNGLNVSELPSTVWLKNYPQTIHFPVVTTAPLFVENDLQVVSVKNVSLKTGVLRVLGDETVAEQKVFQRSVHVTRSVQVENGGLLGGADVASFREEVYSDKQRSGNTVSGMKTFRTLDVFGNICGRVNGLDLSKDTLQLNKPQSINGELTMESHPLVVVGDLSARRMEVDVINEREFRELIQNSVLKRNASSMMLQDKYFTGLKANELSVAVDGGVDGVDLLQMLLGAVTLNSPQHVDGRKDFTGPIKFDDHAMALTVRDIDLVRFVNTVVLVDRMDDVVTGRKAFSGIIGTDDITVDSINDVKLQDLQRDTMSKTKDNHLKEVVFFEGNVDADVLFVNPSGSLDGVQLDDMAKLSNHEVLRGVNFLSSVKVAEDVFVSGLVNGCDLNVVSSHALRSSEEGSQTVSGDVIIDSLQIRGNLIVEGDVNDVSMKALRDSLVDDAGYQVVAGEIHVSHGIAVSQLLTKGLLNSTDLSGLIEDAVKKSVDQTVTGYKTIQDDLEADVILGSGQLFLLESLNDVDIGRMRDATVWKSGFQVIGGDKSFGQTRARNATAYEYFNGIKIPFDLVLTASEEAVTSPLFVMDDVEIHADMNVLGDIRGIDLRRLVEGAVSLTADEHVTSDITFAENVIVNGLTVDGMLNDVVLEMVTRTNRTHLIDGSKNFGDLYVAGDVTASSVNELDVEELSNTILSPFSDELIRDLQVFTQPIYAQKSLAVNWTNGVALPYMTETFLERSKALTAIFDFFAELGNSQDKDIVSQLNAVSALVSSFAYFTLHQQLHIEAAARVLTSYPQLQRHFNVPQSVVMWTSRKYCMHGSCCSEDHSFWISADTAGILHVNSGPHTGRYFPVQVQGKAVVREQNLVVWTNSTISQAEWCKLAQETVIGTIEQGKYLRPYFKLQNSATLTDIKAFKDGYTYIVAAYSYDNRNDVYAETVVYRGDDAKEEWAEYQYLPVYGVLTVDLTTYSYKAAKNEVLLALGSGMVSYPGSRSSVYRWNSDTRMFDLLENIRSQNVASVLWIRTTVHLLLAAASVDHRPSDISTCTGVTQGGRIDVYLYDEKLKWIQSIALPGVVSMVSFTIEGETYLAVVSKQMQTVFVLQWKGYSGFATIQSMYVRDCTNVAAYWVGEQLYLTVASGAGSSKVLKAVTRGRPPANSVDLRYRRPNEQGDQPTETNNVQKRISDC